MSWFHKAKKQQAKQSMPQEPREQGEPRERDDEIIVLSCPAEEPCNDAPCEWCGKVAPLTHHDFPDALPSLQSLQLCESCFFNLGFNLR